MQKIYTLAITPEMKDGRFHFHLFGIYSNRKKVLTLLKEADKRENGHVIHEYFYMYAVLETRYMNSSSASCAEWFKYNLLTKEWDAIDPPAGYENVCGFI